MKNTFRLGNDLEIRRIGYGAMQLTGDGVFGDAPDRANALKLLQAAVELGINFIDTADAYGPNTNEKLIADALPDFKARKILVATKGGLVRPGPGDWRQNGDPAYIAGAIEGSLERLKVESIDLWQLHRVDRKFSIEETLAPVLKAVKAGKIKHVGLSEVTVQEIERAEKVVPIASVQNLYNVQNRASEAVLDYTAKMGMAFIPWFPLGSDPDSLRVKLEKTARTKNASVAQIALAWLLHRSENILLIPGTKSIAHLKENFEAEKIELTAEEFRGLS